MQLTDDQVREYAALYKQTTGEELPFEEAREIATRLVSLYVLLRNRLPSERGTHEAPEESELPPW